MILHLANDYSGSTVYKNLVTKLDDLGVNQIVYTPVRSEHLVGENEIELKQKDSKIIYANILAKYTGRLLLQKNHIKMSNFTLKTQKVVFFWCFLTLACTVFSQSDNKEFDELLIDYPSAVKITLSGNSYDFMKLRSHLGALNVMVKETTAEEYIYKQITLVNNLISSSRLSNSIVKNVTYKDEFQGWIVNKANDKNKNTINKEIPLFESYSFFYVTEFLFLLKESGWINHSQENWKWWEETVRFVEQNIWTKWRTRSYIASKTYNKTFLRSRTHMGSHWAGVAMYLNKLTHNKQIKEQTETLLNQYDMLLKRNLKPFGRAYVWNATYDDVTNTDASKVKDKIIQDGSHGNHVVSYVIAAYELGNPNWTLQDIHRLAYTLVDLMYDEKTNSFRDNVDGSNDKNRPGWGNFVGDGWVKLAAYNEEAKKVLLKFNKNTNKLKRYNQEVQFKSTLSPLLNDD